MANISQTTRCSLGTCPPLPNADDETIMLSHGAGGREMQSLITDIRNFLPQSKRWKHQNDDGATRLLKKGQYVFTSDSYVVTPLFFPGGNIGTIAFCGTINDLSVMGGEPLALSLNFIIEEGLPKKILFATAKTIGDLSRQTSVPVVTGDTKVVEKGSLDKLMIATSGIGHAKKPLDEKIEEGDTVIVSGGIGEHGAALLAKRFEMETEIMSDSKPLWEEIRILRNDIKQAKDITRGGLAATLNELALKNQKGMLIQEEKIPAQKSVRSLTGMLGIEILSLACEGKFVCICSPKKANIVLKKIRRFHKNAEIIGRIQKGNRVIAQTRFGKKEITLPSGNIVPRIC